MLSFQKNMKMQTYNSAGCLPLNEYKVSHILALIIFHIIWHIFCFHHNRNRIVKGGGAHWALMWHLARRGVSWFLISEYALWFPTSPLMMVPINFWWNSDLVKKRHFSSPKTDEVRAFLDKSLNRKSIKS